MEYFDYISQASKTLAPITAILASLVPILIIIFSIIRTKSFHIPMMLFWQILNRKNTLQDKHLNDFLGDRNSVMKFRTITGIPVRTKNEMQELIEWSNKNNEDIDDIKRCGNLFNIRKPGEIKSIKKWHYAALLTGLIISGMTIGLIFGAITIEKSLFKTKKSQTWFFMTKQKSITDFWSNYEITETSCKNPSQIQSNFSKEDISIFCQTLSIPDYSKITSSALTEQRLLLAILEIYAIFLASPIIIRMRQRLHAESMIKRLQEKYHSNSSKTSKSDVSSEESVAQQVRTSSS